MENGKTDVPEFELGEMVVLGHKDFYVIDKITRVYKVLEKDCIKYEYRTKSDYTSERYKFYKLDEGLKLFAAEVEKAKGAV